MAWVITKFEHKMDCWWNTATENQDIFLCTDLLFSQTYTPSQYFTLPHGFQQTLTGMLEFHLESARMVEIYHSARFRWNPSGIPFQQIPSSFRRIPWAIPTHSMGHSNPFQPIPTHSNTFHRPFQHIPGGILFQWIPSAIQMSCDLVWP